ncbi:MAG: hypothetical protein IOD12_06790 [Silvanigrellales bacterium]|nr:hypothetical protein [Silvanigrellales bacterium]
MTTLMIRKRQSRILKPVSLFLNVSLFSVLATTACNKRDFNNGENTKSGTSAVVKPDAGATCVVETDSSVEALYMAANDAFKMKVLKAADCPAKMGAKDPYRIDSFMANAGCKIGKRFIVSEKGQVSVSRESGVDPRTVDEWICGVGTGGVDPNAAPGIEGRVWISGPGTAMHIIAWDSINKTFNFYSADHPTDGGQIYFHGNSHTQATSVKNSFRHACTNCHVGGGLLMKELRFPWAFWHTPVSPLPGVENKAWTRAADRNHPVEIAEHFEVQTIQTITAANQAYVNNLLAGKAMGAPLPQNRAGIITYRDLLYPLFCERGVGLASSPSTYASGKVNVPPDLFLNRLLAPQNGRVTLTSGIDIAKKGQTSRLDMSGFADTTDFDGLFDSKGGANSVAEYSKADWVGVTKGIFSIKGGAANPDGDIFPMLIPVRHFADDDLVSRLVANGVIPEDFALNVLLTDLQNPVFSGTRCGLISKVPAEPVRSGGGSAMVQAFEAAVNADPDKGNAGSGAAKYLSMKAVADKAAFVTAFANGCKTNLTDPLKGAKAMAMRWQAFHKAPAGIGAPFKGADFNRAIEDFVETAAIPAVTGSVTLVGITQGCDVK